jgi:2-octaprenylphenol hydroxylase
MHVWDATGGGVIHFEAAELGEPNLGHIIENRVILAALLDRMDEFENIDLLCPAEAVELALGDEPRVTLADGRVLTAPLVVGADGSQSRVRSEAGIETTGWGYDQSAVVATVKTSQHHRDTAWQRFMPDGPLAFLPLPQGYSSIVWSTRPEEAERLVALNEPAFLDELQSTFGESLGRMEWTGPRGAFPLMLQHADSYVKPGVALIGNAAHTIHPLAGQGLNLGVSDAAALAEVLVEAGPGRFGDMAVLRRYERWRKADNVAIMGSMDVFKRLFGNQQPVLRWLRNEGLKLTNAAGPVKNFFVRRAMGLSGDLPRLSQGVPLQ